MIKHAFTSLIPDGAETDKVQPTDWNAPHVIELLTTDPATPVTGDLWMLASGTTPDRLLELKFCDSDGVVVTLFTVLR